MQTFCVLVQAVPEEVEGEEAEVEDFGVGDDKCAPLAVSQTPLCLIGCTSVPGRFGRDWLNQWLRVGY